MQSLFAAKRCPVRSTPDFLVVLFAVFALPGEAGAEQLHPLRFKGADGTPMAVERVGNGFLLAQDDVLSNAEKDQ
jgi:hypothetical protein